MALVCTVNNWRDHHRISLPRCRWRGWRTLSPSDGREKSVHKTGHGPARLGKEKTGTQENQEEDHQLTIHTTQKPLRSWLHHNPTCIKGTCIQLLCACRLFAHLRTSLTLMSLQPTIITHSQGERSKTPTYHTFGQPLEGSSAAPLAPRRPSRHLGHLLLDL